MSQRPVLSFVATSRNDDHGGDALRRTQSFINRLAEQCERHKVAAELVLVEWNPPRSRPPLANVLAWPPGNEWFSARVITVPERLHIKHKYARRLSLFQMIAKNVGIRQALGDYIIATNIDIIFSDEIFEWFRRGRFRQGVLYRSDRWDIPNEIQLEPDIDTLLKRAHEEAVRRNIRQGIHLRRSGEWIANAGSDLESIFHNINQKLTSLIDQSSGGSDTTSAWMTDRLRGIVDLDMPRLRRDFRIPKLHTVACGDFTMLSRQDWFALRGYPEWHLYSWHIDSILVYQAYYNGLEICEIGEGCVHYHIEHGYGSGWTPEAEGSLWDRLDQLGVPYLSFHQYLDHIYEMQDNAEKKLFTVYNRIDWGLYRDEIEFREIVNASTAGRPALATNQGPLAEDCFPTLRAAPFGMPEERAFSHANGVRAEYQQGEDGSPELHIVCEEPWGYAAVVDIAHLAERFEEYFISVELLVETGSVGVAVLDAEARHFLHEAQFAAGDQHWRKVLRPVNDAANASKLILRNATPDGGAVRFQLRRLELLVEGASEEQLDARETAVSRPAQGDVPCEPVPAFTESRINLGLSLLCSGADGSMVQLLRPASISQEGLSQSNRALIVTPSERNTHGAHLKLPRQSKIVGMSIDLRVLDGTAGLGIWSSGVDLIVEKQAAEGAPVTRVEFDFRDGEMPESPVLVIRNLSETGAAKVLLHTVNLYERGSGGPSAVSGHS